MIDPLVPLGDGHTELSEQDRLGLIPTYIATRGELFDAEQRNIAQALLRRPPSIAALFDDAYLRRLHRAIFGQVWEWAGQYRIRETNIGIAFEQISSEIHDLVNDTRTWVDYSTYEQDEIAVRFHHRLVAIHAFPNGNGRHGRIAADYLVVSLKREPFTWGFHLDTDTDELRAAYLHALRRADRGDIEELLAFSRA
ncbi:MAG: mobile mystery protein B [Actinomycetota bacterium]|nr:mobile mystery protein B [Actinomycetota bacterium]